MRLRAFDAFSVIGSAGHLVAAGNSIHVVGGSLHSQDKCLLSASVHVYIRRSSYYVCCMCIYSYIPPRTRKLSNPF